MSMGQMTLSVIGQFLKNNSFLITIFIFWGVLFLDYYNRFLKINRKTDKVNLIKRWSQLQLLRRYKNGFYLD